MYQNLKKRTEGFTIIEVLIVLAIAGLIMLIVFLAVPALQRNSRNTQRRSDASKLASAVVEWSNNNNGRMPSNATEQGQAVANTNLGIYNGTGNVTWGTAHPSGTGAENNIVIAANRKCNGEDSTTAQTRSVAILYVVETGGGTQAQCEES